MKTSLTTLIVAVAVMIAALPEPAAAQSGGSRGNSQFRGQRQPDNANRGGSPNFRLPGGFRPPWLRPGRPPEERPTPPPQEPELPDNDRIFVDGNAVDVEFAPGVPGKIQIRLAVNRNVTWWKGINITDADGRSVFLELQDRPGGATPYATFDRADFGGGRLSYVKIDFWKAKLLGVHTYIRSLGFNANTWTGYRVTLRWNE